MNRNAPARFLRNPALEGVEICQVSRSGHTFPNHFHENLYAFSLMEEGGCYWTGPEKSDSLVEPGNMALIPPGQIHSGSSFRKGASTYKMIYLDRELLKKASSQILECPPAYPEFSRIVFSDDRLAFAAGRFYHSFMTSGDGLELESLLYEFLGPLFDQFESSPDGIVPAGRDNPRILLAVDYLSENLDRKISLEDTAEQVGMSQYHFLRTFKKTIGLSPHAFRTQKRIEAARALILDGMPFSRVALDTGFTDQSHFTRKFRDYTGVTPARYFSRVGQ